MSSFALQMRQFQMDTNTRMDLFIRQTVQSLAKKVIKRSPVGDSEWWLGRQVSSGVYEHASVPEGYVGGHFRGNWQYGFGSVPSDDVSDIDPDGNATLRKFAGISQPIGVHYIVNNLPYAQALEDGHSWHQAPFGMVGLAMAEINSELDAIAREAAR